MVVWTNVFAGASPHTLTLRVPRLLEAGQRALNRGVLVLLVGPGTNADFLDCGGEMGEALESVISEGGNGTAASQMMSSQAEGLDG